MASSDADALNNLKTARDAILAAIAGGSLTVSYSFGNETVTVEASTAALERIENLIGVYTRKATRSARSPFRVVSLRRASARGE